MKKIIFTLIFLVYTINIFAQQTFSCRVIGEDKAYGYIPNSDEYIPNEKTPIKIIRVNIHFILHSQENPNYPGNFTKYDDGNGNPNFTGYDYAELLIKTANNRLAHNTQMKLPPGNNTPVLQRKYRYYLNGVFFHENEKYYHFDYSIIPMYTENPGECINVYLNCTNNDKELAYSGLGVATMSGNRKVTIGGCWDRYISDINNGISIMSGIWLASKTLNHEIGHNLSLYHPTCPSSEDYCSDTPTRYEIINNYGFDPCDPDICGWCNNENPCHNNMMDYTCYDAVTPQQLGRIHWTIENDIPYYKTCKYMNEQVLITNFTENKAYIGKKVIIPENTSITITDNNELFINGEEVIIKGELTLSNGMLKIKTVKDCDIGVIHPFGF